MAEQTVIRFRRTECPSFKCRANPLPLEAVVAGATEFLHGAEIILQWRISEQFWTFPEGGHDITVKHLLFLSLLHSQ